MGMLMDESFYSLSETCGMEAEDACERPGQSIDMGCCDDENLAFAGIDVISFVKKQIGPSTVDSVVNSHSYATSKLQSAILNHASLFPPPEPLPYGRNLLVRAQRFLI